MAVHLDQLVKIVHVLKYVQYFVFLIQVDQFCGSALKIWLSNMAVRPDQPIKRFCF